MDPTGKPIEAQKEQKKNDPEATTDPTENVDADAHVKKMDCTTAPTSIASGSHIVTANAMGNGSVSTVGLQQGKIMATSSNALMNMQPGVAPQQQNGPSNDQMNGRLRGEKRRTSSTAFEVAANGIDRIKQIAFGGEIVGNKEAMQVQIKMADRYFNRMMEQYCPALQEAETEEEIEMENRYLEIEHMYMATIAFLQEQISRLETRATNNVKSEEQNNGIAARRKLKRVDPERFNGDSSKWCAFRDTFIRFIHEDEQLDDTEKFYHLVQACIARICLNFVQ